MTRAVLIALLTVLALSARLYANTVTPQIGGGISQFDGGIGTQAGTVTPPPSSCANGNLLLQYNDACQLMSQMVGN